MTLVCCATSFMATTGLGERATDRTGLGRGSLLFAAAGWERSPHAVLFKRLLSPISISASVKGVQLIEGS